MNTARVPGEQVELFSPPPVYECVCIYVADLHCEVLLEKMTGKALYKNIPFHNVLIFMSQVRISNFSLSLYIQYVHMHVKFMFGLKITLL